MDFTVLAKGIALAGCAIGAGLALITFSLPMTIFLLTGFFRSMPGEMFEAAAIDGCGIYGCFFRIALPLCRLIPTPMTA